MDLRRGFSRFLGHLVNDQQIAVTVDRGGRITRVFAGETHHAYWSIFQLYARSIAGEKLSSLFRLPAGAGSLRTAALTLRTWAEVLTPETFFKPQASFFSKNRFERFGTFYGFHSNIPPSRLLLRYFEPVGFFGLIRFHGIAVLADFFRAQPLAILDPQGNLRGMNHKLLDLFGKKSAEKLLGKPEENFFRPGPMGALAGARKEFRAALAGPWRSVMTRDFGGAVWSHTRENRGLFPLEQPLNSRKSDFRVDVRFENRSGRTPGIIFHGVGGEDPAFPDYKGYLLGPDPFERIFYLKKEGAILHQAPYAARPGLRTHVLTAVRRGSAVACFLDEAFVIGFRDPDMTGSRRSFQYLLNRPGDRFILRSAAVSTLPRSENLHQGFNEGSFAGQGDKSYRFHLLASDALRLKGSLFYGVVFYDVTYLKRNISLLKKAAVDIASERDKYKAMALGHGDEGPFIGESRAVRALRAEARKAAASPVTVLIEGETGTGKEVLARTIHGESPFRNGPFFKVDCAAIPEALLESELFGAEKGAFTGAEETRTGKLEAAAGGTLFLDELSNLTPAVQAKLLQFLQDRTLTRLGSTRPVKVEARVIGASNRPLKTLVDQGHFRADLYYRLNAVRLAVPPLRERREDVPRLVSHFLSVYNARFHRAVKGFSPAAGRALAAHGWPGNVRELENAVQNAVVFADGDVIERIDLDAGPASGAAAGASPPPTEGAAIPKGDPRALTRGHVVELLRRNNKIVARAAKDAGVCRATMFNKLRKFGIRPER